MSRVHALLILLLLAVIAVSCSGSSNPMEPSGDTGTTPAVSRDSSGTSHLWGWYEVTLDPETGAFESVPLRGPAFTANVVGFVDGPPPNLILDIQEIIPGGGYMDIDVNVGLRHPFPGLDMYTGFEVLGVFMGEGSQIYPGDEGFPVAGSDDQQLLNPDGFTRWFNAFEFETAMPLLSYIPGKLGTPGYTPSAHINPYKLYADTIEIEDSAFDALTINKEDRGAFRPGYVNYRNYLLRFPDGAGVTFQYAVVAHWEEPITIPDPPSSLDDFPWSANAIESLAIKVVDNTEAWYVDGTDFGGTISLDVSTANLWHGNGWTVHPFEIEAYSDAYSTPVVVDYSSGIPGDAWFDFTIEFPAETLTSSGQLPIWLEIRYPDFDYTNEFGISNMADGMLTSYFLTYAAISDTPIDQPWIKVLTPDGGEEWNVGSTQEITWDSNLVTGNVMIEYSKDDFVADFNTISADEPNDGLYDWVIPDDVSDMVKVRITSIDDPAVDDESDEYFSIVPAWIEVTTPNGDEIWIITGEYDIEWDTSDGITDVRIDYSTDSGATYPNVITASTENDGVFEWTIPDDPTETAKVRIQTVTGPTAEDESDDVFTITDASDNFLYGMAEVAFTYYANDSGNDNDTMFINLLGLPLTGPYSSGTKVLWYWGHADDYSCDDSGWVSFITSQGYTYESNGDSTLTASHLNNVKMMIVSFMFLSTSDPSFTASEIQVVKDFINGGGVCIVIMDNGGVMGGYGAIDDFLDDLGVDFSAYH